MSALKRPDMPIRPVSLVAVAVASMLLAYGVSALGQSPDGFVPRLIADVSATPGGRGSTPQQWRRAGDRTWFVAARPGGSSIHVIDEATGIVLPVGEPHGISQLPYPELLDATSGGLFFTRAFDATREVWFTDGTEDGTRIIATSSSSGQFAFPPLCVGIATTVGAHVLCTRIVAGLIDTQWWFSDVAGNNTVLLATLPEFRVYAGSVATRGARACAVLSGPTSVEFWSSDGHPATTQRDAIVPDDKRVENRAAMSSAGHCIAPLESLTGSGYYSSAGTGGMATRLIGFAEPQWDLGPVLSIGADAMFIAPTKSSSDFELWRTDGTSAGTRLIRQLPPPDAGNRQFAAGSGIAAFTASPGVAGTGLWLTDGTVAGTSEVPPAPGNFFALRGVRVSGGTVIVRGGDANGEGDYIVGASRQLVRLGEPFATPLDPGSEVVGDGTRIWLGARGDDGFEPAMLTPASGNVTILDDLWPSTASTLPMVYPPFRTQAPEHTGDVVGDVAFQIIEQGASRGVLRVRPSTGEASLLAGVPGEEPKAVHRVGSRVAVHMDTLGPEHVRLGDATAMSLSPPLIAECAQLDLQAFDPARLAVVCQRYDPLVLQLLRSDGTAAGTSVIDSLVGAVPLTFRFAAGSGGVLPLFMRESSEASPYPLFAVSGSGFGHVAAPWVEPCVSVPRTAATSGGVVFFAMPACDLWVMRPTKTAERLGPLQGNAGGPVYEPDGPVALDDGRAAFTAMSGGRAELWLTDGTSAGTQREHVFDAQNGATIPGFPVTHADGVVFLTLSSGAFAFEVASGDIFEISSGDRLRVHLAVAGGTAYAVGEDGEPWVIRRTSTGYDAWRIADLYPGPAGSSPRGFQVVGTDVLFFADDGTHGVEPYALALDAVFSDGVESRNSR